MGGRAERMTIPGTLRAEARPPSGWPVFLALGLLPAGLLPMLLGSLGWAFGAVALAAGGLHLGAAVRARPRVGTAGRGSPGRRTAFHLGALVVAGTAEATLLETAGPAPEALPHLHAVLNGWTTVFLLAGIASIRRGRREAHRAYMLSAAAASAVFLASYVVYHARVGSVPFDGTGAARTVYLVVLVSHVVLAAGVVPAVLVTVARGLAGREERHRRIARWTFPAWLYVSVTGLVVYWAVHGG